MRNSQEQGRQLPLDWKTVGVGLLLLAACAPEGADNGPQQQAEPNRKPTETPLASVVEGRSVELVYGEILNIHSPNTIPERHYTVYFSPEGPIGPKDVNCQIVNAGDDEYYFECDGLNLFTFKILEREGQNEQIWRKYLVTLNVSWAQHYGVPNPNVTG